MGAPTISALPQPLLAQGAYVLRVTGVHTVCRREVVGARRELGINLWIEPPNARASPCHLACAWCRLVPPMLTGLLGAPAGS